MIKDVCSDDDFGFGEDLGEDGCSGVVKSCSDANFSFSTLVSH